MSGRRRNRHWSTALVTGASSGIGEAMAMRLARAGSDLVLVARREERLAALAAELRSQQRCAVEVMVADLADGGDLARVEQRLLDSDRPVDLLVNNAGFGTRGQFASLPVSEEERELRVNVLAPVRLTHAALEGMVARRHGAVINVSSIASLQPIPYWATYSATKAYLTSFSISVHEEVKASGVTVLALMPGFTRTEFQERESLGLHGIPGPAWMSSPAVAKAALKAAARGRATCVPGWHYRVLAGVTWITPWKLSRRVLRAGSARMP